MTKHRDCYKHYLHKNGNFTTVFHLFNEFGIENCRIEPLEMFPCNKKSELEAREGHDIRNEERVNRKIMGRSKQDEANNNITGTITNTYKHKRKNTEKGQRNTNMKWTESIGKRTKKPYQNTREEQLSDCGCSMRKWLHTRNHQNIWSCQQFEFLNKPAFDLMD